MFCALSQLPPQTPLPLVPALQRGPQPSRSQEDGILALVGTSGQAVALLVGQQGRLGLQPLAAGTRNIFWPHGDIDERILHELLQCWPHHPAEHPCEGFGSKGQPKLSMYLGKDVFISMDASESSLSPLPIPKELKAKEAVVSTITFVHSHDGDQWPGLPVLREPWQVGPISRSHLPCV